MATETTEPESPNIAKAKELLLKSEDAVGQQEAAHFQQLAQAWLQIEQIERQGR